MSIIIDIFYYHKIDFYIYCSLVRISEKGGLKLSKMFYSFFQWLKIRFKTLFLHIKGIFLWFTLKKIFLRITKSSFVCKKFLRIGWISFCWIKKFFLNPGNIFYHRISKKCLLTLKKSFEYQKKLNNVELLKYIMK